MTDYTTLEESSLHNKLMEGKINSDMIINESLNIIKLLGLNPKSVEHVMSDGKEDQIIFPISTNITGLSSMVMGKLASNSKFIGLLIEKGYMTVLVKSENK